MYVIFDWLLLASPVALTHCVHGIKRPFGLILTHMIFDINKPQVNGKTPHIPVHHPTLAHHHLLPYHTPPQNSLVTISLEFLGSTVRCNNMKQENVPNFIVLLISSIPQMISIFKVFGM